MSEEMFKRAASVLEVFAILAGLAISTASLRIAIGSAEDSSAALEATQRSVDAQTQPLVVEAPRGDKLDDPLPVEFYPFGPRNIWYPGEIVIEPVRGQGALWFVSVPVLNAGSGIARITSAIADLAASPGRLPGGFVAPQQQRRLTNVLPFPPGYQGSDLMLTVSFEDFAGRSKWETALFLASRQPVGSGDWYVRTVDTRRVN